MNYWFAASLVISLQMASSLAQVRDTNLGVDPNFQCPVGSSIAPHPQRCDLYYTCYGGQPVYLWQCRDNLLYDLTYNGCNWPEQTYCGNRTVPGVSTPAPFSCAKDGFFAADASHCIQKYYTCLDGVAFSTMCPSYGVFEPTRQICVSPSSPSCQALNGNTTSAPTISTQTTTPTISTQTITTGLPPNPVNSTSTTTSTASPGQFTCPSANGTFPDSSDCRYYYTCDNGTAYRFACPGGLVFNPTSKVCDWPYNVPSC